MNALNNLILEGKITKDVELSILENGCKVARTTISYTRSYKNASEEIIKEENFFENTCYGVMAEIFAKLGKVGRGIRIVGRLTQEGEKVVILAEHIEYKLCKN
jgi:single-strand DNA-binding protein